MPNATLERPSAAEVKITVELSPADYQGPAKAELKRIAKQAKIKGFRPGKVPVSYIKNMYGRGAVAEAIGKAVDGAINEVIKEHDLEVFGQLQPLEEPDLSGVSADLDDALTFVYEGGLMPSVETLDTGSLSAAGRYTVALSDEEAAEKLDGARKRFVDYAERDTVEAEEDFATLVVADADLDAKFLGAAGEAHSAEPTVGNDAKEGADADTAEHDGDEGETPDSETPKGDTPGEEEEDPRQRYFLRAADLKEEQRYKLVDKARGTEILLALDDLNDDIRERFDKAIPADGTTSFTIAKVDREEMPELDEETYKKIFGEGTAVSTEEEARAEFSRLYAENSQKNLDDFALEQIIDALAAANEVAIPEAAVKARLEQARADELKKAEEEGRDPEFDHELSAADRYGLARRLKWLAFRQALLKEHDVELEAADIDAGIDRQFTAQMSGMGVDPEMFRDRFYDTFKRNLLENREQVMEMTDELLNAKLLAKLEEAGVLGERKQVSEQEFGAIVERYNADVKAEMDELRKQPI